MSNSKQSLCTDRQTAWTLLALLIGFVTIGLVASSCATRRKSTLPPYDLIASPVGQRYLTRPSRAEVDSLVTIYGRNKGLLPEYSDVLVVALSYYPELQSTYIKFEYSSEQTTMASRETCQSIVTSSLEDLRGSWSRTPRCVLAHVRRCQQLRCRE